MATSLDTSEAKEVYFSLEDISFSKLRENAVIQEANNEFVPINNASIIIDFGVAQCWISEDLVVIEPRVGGKTTAALITAEGEEMKITGVTLVQCNRDGKSATFNCLITPDLQNSVVLSFREALNMGMACTRPI